MSLVMQLGTRLGLSVPISLHQATRTSVICVTDIGDVLEDIPVNRLFAFQGVGIVGGVGRVMSE